MSTMAVEHYHRPDDAEYDDLAKRQAKSCLFISRACGFITGFAVMLAGSMAALSAEPTLYVALAILVAVAALSVGIQFYGESAIAKHAPARRRQTRFDIEYPGAGLRIYTDVVTGLRYVGTTDSSMTPLIGKDGRQERRDL